MSKSDDRSRLGLLGHAFERRVCSAFERSGYALLQKNKWMKNYDFKKDSATKREYDLVMLDISSLELCIIECKAHFSKKSLVDLCEIKEFKDKLENYKGRYGSAIVVTDTSYVSTAVKYAKYNNIKLFDGQDLVRFEKNGSFLQGLKSKGYSSLLSKAGNSLDLVVSKYL